jgi:hypothetical protein
MINLNALSGKPIERCFKTVIALNKEGKQHLTGIAQEKITLKIGNQGLDTIPFQPEGYQEPLRKSIQL